MAARISLAISYFIILSACSSTTKLYLSDPDSSQPNYAIIKPVAAKDKKGYVRIAPLFVAIAPLNKETRSNNRIPESTSELDAKEIHVAGGRFRLTAICTTAFYTGLRSFEGVLQNGFVYEFACLDDQSDIKKLILLKKYPISQH